MAEPLHVTHWGIYVTTPVVSPEKAQVRVHTKIENETEAEREVKLQSRLFAPDGAVLGTAESSSLVPAYGLFEFSQDIRVTNPQLWSVEITNALSGRDQAALCRKGNGYGCH